jgi:hypothetical protein
MPADQAESTESAGAPPADARAGVSLFHLYALRALFFMMALFLLSTSGPRLMEQPPTVMTGVARALFTALGLLAALGVLYPLRMLPIMVFEFAWKTLWMVFIGLPLWSDGQLAGDQAETFKAVLAGVILCPIAIPWRYLWVNYLKRPGDRWR